MPEGSEFEIVRRRLAALGEVIRERLLEEGKSSGREKLAAVVDRSPADTVFHIDRVSEEVILGWLERNWPEDEPLALVMEGLPEDRPIRYPEGTSPGAEFGTLILDPVDGTRCLMHDKRAAWSLAAYAPVPATEARLGDLRVAAMTELPTSRQGLAVQISGVSGCGARGLHAESWNRFTDERHKHRLEPSKAVDMRQGFGSVVRFFPGSKQLASEIEENIWKAIYGPEVALESFIFEEQYISTGGQLHELMAGHDRFVADLRPPLFRELGLDIALSCHPYDICTELLAREAGCCVLAPDGAPLDAPLDTTTPVAWVAFANPRLRDHILPALQAELGRLRPAEGGL